MNLSDLPTRVKTGTARPLLVCPQCGSQLELDRACRITKTFVPKFPSRERPTVQKTITKPAALCPSCDYCVEL